MLTVELGTVSCTFAHLQRTKVISIMLRRRAATPTYAERILQEPGGHRQGIQGRCQHLRWGLRSSDLGSSWFGVRAPLRTQLQRGLQHRRPGVVYPDGYIQLKDRSKDLDAAVAVTRAEFVELQDSGMQTGLQGCRRVRACCWLLHPCIDLEGSIDCSSDAPTRRVYSTFSLTCRVRLSLCYVWQPRKMF